MPERAHKLGFILPSDVMLILPLAITAAAAELTSFREVLHYENMMLSFARTSQYEGAGTV